MTTQTWKMWLKGTLIEHAIPPGEYVVTPEILVEAVGRRLDALDEEARMRIREKEFPKLTDITESICDLEVTSGFIGEVCREHGVSRVSAEPSGATHPFLEVRFLDDIDPRWLVIWLTHSETTERPFLHHWIFGRREDGVYKYFPVPEGFRVGDNGTVWLKWPGHEEFDLGELQLDLMLDRGRAAAIGLIREALEDNEGRAIRSLKKCPHPYRRFGIELGELLEELESVLQEY